MLNCVDSAIGKPEDINTIGGVLRVLKARVFTNIIGKSIAGY